MVDPKNPIVFFDITVGGQVRFLYKRLGLYLKCCLSFSKVFLHVNLLYLRGVNFLPIKAPNYFLFVILSQVKGQINYYILLLRVEK